MGKKAVLLASALSTLLIFTGCAGAGTSYSVGVGAGTVSQSGVAVEASAPPPMPKAKEVDENLLVFHTAVKLAQRLGATSKAIKPGDKLMVLNFDSEEDSIAVDKLKEGGSGIDGITILKSDTLKAAEDGLISGLLGSGVSVVDKFSGPQWPERDKAVFYANVITPENLEAIRTKFNVTKIFAYRWVGYTPADTSMLWFKKPTRVRLSCRVIDTATGSIAYNEIITEEYVPLASK